MENILNNKIDNEDRYWLAEEVNGELCYIYGTNVRKENMKRYRIIRKHISEKGFQKLCIYTGIITTLIIILIIIIVKVI